MTSNDEQSYIFMNYRTYLVQQKRSGSKILLEFRKRAKLARFLMILVGWRPFFAKNESKNAKFARILNSDQIFDSNLFDWTT